MHSLGSDFDVSVLIVGAGPVGTVLALDLASRGIDVAIAETRYRGEPPSVKCNHISARSMEIFRRLGIVQEIRNAGLPADYPNDVSYRTTTTGIELSRIRIPARAGHMVADAGAAAPLQPDFLRTDPDRARLQHTEDPHAEPDAVRRLQTGRERRYSRTDRP
jgi:2-polyprenyl-6-methoxyphenol hydroxylase-like FAD-dependent oxidoreductase